MFDLFCGVLAVDLLILVNGLELNNKTVLYLTLKNIRSLV